MPTLKQAHPPRKSDRVAAQRCSCCRRALPTGRGTPVPGLGVVGPECAAQVGALALALQQRGLAALLTDGGLALPLENGKLHDGMVPTLEALRALGVTTRAETALVDGVLCRVHRLASLDAFVARRRGAA